MNALDTVLDRSVIGGYSRLGYAARARRWSAKDPRPGSLADRTVAVTGATSGIGAAIAAGVVELGGQAILVGRDRDRADAVRASIRSRHSNAKVEIELADVSDPAQVTTLAEQLAGYEIDSLIHNAGVMPPERTESVDGHELSLATHVLGPLRLTDLLVERLAHSVDPRVIFMSSGGMYTAALPTDDIEYRSGRYRGARAYARSKRIQTALLPILADRWASAGVMVAAMHPGWVDTPGVADSLPGFKTVAGPLLRSAEEGADTALWLTATSETLPSGRFWHDREIRPLHYLPGTRFSEADRRAIWRTVSAAAGVGEELDKP
ncbi:MAG: SDR family NAD(P)-dependent oxidoreductase [Gordonia sp. (in: high G+C Gram-positive bacteria)]|uniref:SDR family NAD(P)-dependent oxidoreductase n=1 Tax=Gordonia sp. (in: high G+C Gram-positive bacteria) TaxID=84139 RepID=UPI003C74DD39